ncbi:MAG TPA: T9SS type A sorting domain-containing protein, partial [Candidatus Cloacimonetes bacterium]|nr:T9SS type A sorting domain-containing protein [Candidatus Cloacimonadota bacterium]
LDSYQTDSAVIAGEDIQLEVTLKNFGSQTANSITAVLSSDNQFVNITDNSADFGNIGAGATSTQNFQFEVLSACPDQEVLEFDLDISNGNDAKLELITSSLIFEVTEFSSNGNNYLELGANDLSVTIENIGSVDTIDLQGTMTSLSSAASVGEIIINFGNVAVGETSEGTFPVNVEADCFLGRNVSFELDLTDDNGLLTSTIFTTVVGDVDNTHPTGHDNYGYFAYDSFDAGYDETPIYEWIEIDPDEGGFGDVILMVDDSTSTIALPFNFTYYGTEYDSISICSNGWISFVPTWETNFTNWNIPAALGPYAMIAAFWDDLIGEEIDPENDIHARMRICHYYDQAENIFIIEWNGCYNREDDVSVEKFEIILYDPDFYQTIDGNGEIQFNYFEVHNIDSNGNYCTVGIENPTQSDGLLYTYANIYPASATELQNGLAIKFTTDPPDDHTLAEDETISNSDFRLFNNHPNPFHLSTTISYNLTAENGEDAEIIIYNIKGQNIRKYSIVNSESSINWNGKDDQGKPVSSGIYFYKMVSGDRKSEIKKCLLLR